VVRLWKTSKRTACLAAASSVVCMALAVTSPVQSIASPPRPDHACSSTTRPTLFADTDAGFLYAIDPVSGHQEWVTQLPQPVDQPYTLSVPACGADGYVVTGSAFGQSAPASARLFPFDLSTGRLGPPVEVGLPGQVAVAPNGRRAYVANSGDLEGLETPGGSSITPVDLVTHRALRPIRLPGQPGGIALIDRGARLLVSLMDKGAVIAVSTATGKLGPVVAFPRTSQGLDVGGPIAVDPADGIALIGNLGQDLVIPAPVINVVDLRSMAPEAPIDLPTQGGAELAVAGDGQWAFATGASGVIPIDLATRTAGSPFRDTGDPVALVASPTHQIVYVGQGTAGEPVVSVPDAGSPITSLTALGGQISGMALSS
jgi:DNA-binding beta-propeller fold protein YncE